MMFMMHSFSIAIIKRYIDSIFFEKYPDFRHNSIYYLNSR